MTTASSEDGEKLQEGVDRFHRQGLALSSAFTGKHKRLVSFADAEMGKTRWFIGP